MWRSLPWRESLLPLGRAAAAKPESAIHLRQRIGCHRGGCATQREQALSPQVTERTLFHEDQKRLSR